MTHATTTEVVLRVADYFAISADQLMRDDIEIAVSEAADANDHPQAPQGRDRV